MASNVEEWIWSASACTAPSNRTRFPAGQGAFGTKDQPDNIPHGFLSTVYFLSHQAVPSIAEVQSHNSSKGHQKKENTGVPPLPTEVPAWNQSSSDPHSGSNWGLPPTGHMTAPPSNSNFYLNQGESWVVKNALHFASELPVGPGLFHRHL